MKAHEIYYLRGEHTALVSDMQYHYKGTQTCHVCFEFFKLWVLSLLAADYGDYHLGPGQ